MSRRERGNPVGGGLVYVEWDDGLVCGVSMRDLKIEPQMTWTSLPTDLVRALAKRTSIADMTGAASYYADPGLPASAAESP